jgi:hypothetical protein
MANEKKSAFLGMPHGTAFGRLRKIVLFSVLKRHEENICARCSKEIETVEELSIEHLKPWEGISVELFWDVDNIAFSHLHCNIKAHRITNRKYFIEHERLTAERQQRAASMRKSYTTEKRREKKRLTGW